jgi:uncharacterized protein YaiE (UPF0345 family)
MSLPAQFENVTVVCKANVYFDGKVVSHTVLSPDGAKRTLGVVLPGSFHFTTAVPERMDIVAGRCRARLAGQADWTAYEAGTGFDVPGESAFDIEVAEADAAAHYICSFGG